MRERLTKRKDLISCETCDDEFCQICDQATDAIDRLAEYEDAEEQGLLVRLPCKVGDTVYVMGQYTADFAEFTVVSFIVCYNIDNKRIEKQFMAKNFKSELTVAFMEENIGKWVFLTRAEAEKKLKELKGEK